MDKTSVLHIGKYFHPFRGGIENFLKCLVESPNYQQEAVVTILAHHADNGLATHVEVVNNVRVIKVKKQLTLLYSPICFSFVAELNKAIETNKPDVLHIHMPNLSAFACLVSSKARKIPWVIHWHADVLGDKPQLLIKLLYPFYRFFEERLLSKADKIIATSAIYRANSKPLSNFLDKTVVIPLGVNVPDTCSIPLKKQSEAPLKLLMVGRLSYYKGHENLIRALADNQNIHLTIIGDGELDHYLKRIVNELKLDDRVVFTGFVEDELLEAEIKACDLLCLPSIEKTEAFGLVLLEAASLGKPALVTDVKGSGMTEVVKHGVTGVVVEPNDIAKLRETLNLLEANRDQLTSLGLNAFDRLSAVYDIDLVARKVVALYQSLND